VPAHWRRRERGRPICLPACLPGEERKVRAIRGKGGYLHVFKVRVWNGSLHVSILESILKMSEEEVVGVMGMEEVRRDLVVVCENWAAVGEGWVSCGTSRIG
jgi:hypothetical protein